MLVLFEGEFAARQTQRFIEEMLDFGHWSWDLTTGIMEWSRGLFDLFGIDPLQVKPSVAEFDKAVHPEDRFIFANVEQMLRQSIAVEREFRIVRGSGRVRWVTFRAEPLAGHLGNLGRAVGICTDITRQREDLLRLRQSEQRLLTVAELSGFLAWLAKPDGSLLEFLNLPDDLRSELTAKPSWNRLVHPDDLEALWAVWQKGIESRQAITADYRMFVGPDSFLPCRVFAAPSFDSDGSIKEWIGVSKLMVHRSSRRVDGQAPITGAQIRAARALLAWSAERLSKESGVKVGTIRRLEEFDGPSSNDRGDLERLETTLANAGVDFILMDEGKPGVRPR